MKQKTSMILVRHGESEWNKKNIFTGWTDIPLSDNGIKEAKKVGKILKKNKFFFHLGYTSYLKRAIWTLWYILEEMNLCWIPIKKNWRLNERHYGFLQGLNKVSIEEQYGSKQFSLWRRSFSTKPPKCSQKSYDIIKNDQKYSNVNKNNIPFTESLEDTLLRVKKYWKKEIKPKILEKNKIIIAAHGNSIRAIIKLLANLNEIEIMKLEIPTGRPILCEFDTKCNYLQHRYI
ncbi:2,3-diphosphoglycerate-dependent phosphoglycerate mutase [bacterium endosymbiont of Pedicinus badii]|uniref:2,3-diphosphoglycerate-dependent phosphoglycerate mutase n=1 Tax=bacterium endosymbiont of Pedicinus badii TaxID=1719126 RepID=UPI0009B9A0CA|nr:2,3-diphosphoglycerate-dependent phosphoglycerate mutase [bacterium endosymbiont of Pedicinus badii]OQM34329.1 phosphoglyceromutase [bacterium endosymbiont of Pedicinus badii]